jgi:hypothetical protein
VDSDPEIWRLLEVDADLTLEQVHEVLQIAMGWRNSHLHSFTDTDPYARLRVVDGRVREPRRWTSAFVLEEDPDGLPETEWTLGQILNEESSPLFYEYDFGDGWTHRLEFVEHLTVPASEPAARLERGERRAPLEDSGGPHGYHDLLEALADPQHEDHQEATEWVAATAGPWRPFDPELLDVDAVNRELALLLPAPGDDDEGGRSQPGTPPLVAELIERMPPALRPEFRSYVGTAQLGSPPEIEADAAERMVAPYLWLIRRVGADGLDLTAAGWLPPAVVRQAMTDLGWEDRWIGKQNREDQTWPVRQLREQAQRLGLLRKLKGRLLLSVAARPLLEDPVGLWFFLARSLAHRHRHDAERDATLLLALELAADRGTDHDCLPAVGFGLEVLGWSAGDSWGLPPEAVRHILRDSEGVLVELGVLQDSLGRAKAASTPAARAFARAVLRS